MRLDSKPEYCVSKQVEVHPFLTLELYGHLELFPRSYHKGVYNLMLPVPVGDKADGGVNLYVIVLSSPS
jgi:hypothetical protein